MVNIALIGDICLDNYCDHKKLMDEIYIGGCGHNIAYALKKLGLQFDFFSILNYSDISKIIVKKIESLGINTEFFLADKPMQKIDINLDEIGERSFSNYEYSILKTWEDLISKENLKKEYDIIIAPYFLEVRPLVDTFISKIRLTNPNVKIFLDLGSISQIEDLHFGDKIFYLNVSGEGSVEYLLGNCDFLTQTRGPEYVTCYENKKIFNVKLEKISPVLDSTGAGDAFFSSMCNFLITKSKEKKMMEMVLESAKFAKERLFHYGGTPGSKIVK